MLALADEYLLAGQIVNRGDRRRSGPVTTTWFTLVRVGSEKATSFSRSGVTVTIAATMSTLPLGERRIQLVARHRHDHHVHLEVAGLQVRCSGRFRTTSAPR